MGNKNIFEFLQVAYVLYEFHKRILQLFWITIYSIEYAKKESAEEIVPYFTRKVHI